MSKEDYIFDNGEYSAKVISEKGYSRSFKEAYLDCIKKIEAGKRGEIKPSEALDALEVTNKAYKETERRRLKLLLEWDDLKSTVESLKFTRNLLIGLLVIIGLSAFLAPVPVKVGDVCLSCWGN